MRNALQFVMIVTGVGLLVLGATDYTPPGTADFAGWSDSCRYVMTIGAMLAVGGWTLPK